MINELLPLMMVLTSLQFADTSATVLCRSANGSEVRAERVLLSNQSFGLDSLIRLFQIEAEQARKNELRLVAYSDRDFWRRQAIPVEIPPPGLEPPGYRLQPVAWPRPVAFLYVVRGSVFFEIWRHDAAPEWVVIKGENVFSHPFGRMTPMLVSEAIVPSTEHDCDRTRRQIEFVLPGLEGLSISEIMPIFKYFQELFPEPAWLKITLYDSFGTATSLGELRAISPHALAAGYGTSENPDGTSVEYSRFWMQKEEAEVILRRGRTTIEQTKIKLR